MTLHPRVSLSFKGDCEAAFRFYERCLNARIVNIFTWGSSPMAGQAPPDWSDKVLHATLDLAGLTVVASDVPFPDRKEPPKGFSLLLNVDDPDDAERVFNLLAENGTIEMPLQQTFWAKRFGILSDQFGVPWTINA
jgi:PhnB protein